MRAKGKQQVKGHSAMHRIIEKTLIPFYAKLRNRLRPGFSSAHHALSLLPERLLTFSRELQADSSRVESDFLRLGRELQETHEDASTLVRFAHDTVVMVNGEEDEGAAEKRDQEAKTREQVDSLRFAKIPGFFPSPPAVVAEVVAPGNADLLDLPQFVCPTSTPVPTNTQISTAIQPTVGVPPVEVFLKPKY